jgi:DtxR family Mn-dependent transcriptional regulator
MMEGTMRSEEHDAPSPVVLEYLELVYALHAEGADAYAVTLAERFGVSRANASATVQRMVRDDLVHVEGRQIQLTAQGRVDAEVGLHRHRITERFLVDVLDMDWATVPEQARHFARGLTPLLEERMDQRLNYPRTCPHGNPIPRPDLDAAVYLRDHHALRLSEASPGAPLVVLTISELAEHNADALRACLVRGFLPGARVAIAASDAAGMLTIQRAAGVTTIEPPLAASIWVVYAEGPGEA